MIGSLDDSALVCGHHFALDDEPQVGPRPECLGETAREQFIVHPDSQPPARDSRLGNFENRGADLPTLADERLIRVNPECREVFAKLTGCKRSADLLLPPA